MSKLKIVHIIQNLNVGGLERVATRLASDLDRSAFEPELWCLSGGGPLEQEFAPALKIRIFDFKRYLLPGNVIKLAGLVKSGRFDIVHTHSYAPGMIGRIAAQLGGAKAVVHHQHSVSAASMNAHMKLLERFVTNALTDAVIVPSEAARRFILEERFARPGMIEVIYNGVPESFEEPSGKAEELKKELGLADARIIAAVGALAPHKGHIFLLRAMARVLSAVPSAKLVIFGEGPERAALVRFISENGLGGRVVLAGLRTDVRPLLESAEVFALPSLTESMSLSTAEAMAKRLPVVACGTGGVPEVVQDGETGFLVGTSRPDAMAERILFLLNNGRAAEGMGHAGYERYKRIFSAGKCLEKVQALYLRLMDGKISHRGGKPR